ncbi:MAG: hypothetical protein ACREUQ_02960, partial [Burkholderiales bacterium]
ILRSGGIAPNQNGGSEQRQQRASDKAGPVYYVGMIPHDLLHPCRFLTFRALLGVLAGVVRLSGTACKGVKQDPPEQRRFL